MDALLDSDALALGETLLLAETDLEGESDAEGEADADPDATSVDGTIVQIAEEDVPVFTYMFLPVASRS